MQSTKKNINIVGTPDPLMYSEKNVNSKYADFDKLRKSMTQERNFSYQGLQQSPFLIFTESYKYGKYGRKVKRTNKKSFGAAAKLFRNAEMGKVGKIYFSPRTKKFIQKLIVKTVYAKTKQTIPPPEMDDIFMVMHHVYTMYGVYQPTNINNQVITLIRNVIELTIPDIIKNMEMYEYYLNDRIENHTFLPYAAMNQSSGSKIHMIDRGTILP